MQSTSLVEDLLCNAVHPLFKGKSSKRSECKIKIGDPDAQRVRQVCLQYGCIGFRCNAVSINLLRISSNLDLFFPSSIAISSYWLGPSCALSSSRPKTIFADVVTLELMSSPSLLVTIGTPPYNESWATVWPL